MNNFLMWIVAGLLVIVVVFLVQIWKRLRTAEKNEVEGDVQNELRSLRENVSRSEQEIRDEIRTNQNASTNTLGEFGSNLTRQVENMRQAVDDRLGEVNRGIGGMQNIAETVDNLNQILTSPGDRGRWGEVKLESLLEEILMPHQYSKNVVLDENPRRIVDYAARLPGSGEGVDSHIWLPIDSKFPLADYEGLDTAKIDSTEELQEATRAFMRAVRNSAKDIHDKYISPPKTTDFAIMFLPTEKIYAEALRVPGQVTELMQRYRIVVAGPTTLAAILYGLRMGFQTLAIQKSSSQIRTILGAVKTEFGRFDVEMNKLAHQLSAASNTVDRTMTRTRAMERELSDIEGLSEEDTDAILGLSDGEEE